MGMLLRLLRGRRRICETAASGPDAFIGAVARIHDVENAARSITPPLIERDRNEPTAANPLHPKDLIHPPEPASKVHDNDRLVVCLGTDHDCCDHGSHRSQGRAEFHRSQEHITSIQMSQSVSRPFHSCIIRIHIPTAVSTSYHHHYHHSHPKRPTRRASNILKTLLPKIIIHQRIPQQPKIHQLRVISSPLRPLDQWRIRAQCIRIQLVNETNIVRLYRRRGDRLQPEKRVQDVGRVEGAEDGGAVEITRQIRPRLDLAADIGEIRAAGEGEGGITEDGGVALEAGIELVKKTSVERGARGDVVGVRSHEAGDLVFSSVREVSLEVLGQGVSVGDVGEGDGEECALVFLVADDDGDFGEGAVVDGFLGADGVEVVVRVWTGEVAEVEGAVADDLEDMSAHSFRGIHCVERLSSYAWDGVRGAEKVAVV